MSKSFEPPLVFCLLYTIVFIGLCTTPALAIIAILYAIYATEQNFKQACINSNFPYIYCMNYEGFCKLICIQTNETFINSTTQYIYTSTVPNDILNDILNEKRLNTSKTMGIAIGAILGFALLFRFAYHKTFEELAEDDKRRKKEKKELQRTDRIDRNDRNDQIVQNV